jgi:hypothetical protein
MTARLFTTASMAVILCSCYARPQLTANHRDMHVAAANEFTERYSRSRLAAWNVRAHAAGTDCDVLFVQTSIIMEESMVDALHYGAGAYAVYAGGVQRFCRDRSFRATAYGDPSGRVWTYGEITAAQSTNLRPCD